MNLNKFTEKAQEAVVAAQNLASDQQHSEVVPEHLLVALVEQSGGIVPSILQKMNLQPAQMATEARAVLKNLPQAYGADLRLSPRMPLSRATVAGFSRSFVADRSSIQRGCRSAL